jgi:transcriptional regulator with XRE-family HTH domain
VDKRSEFSNVLKQAREAQGLSMREVARRLDISVVYYSDVENSIKPPFPPGGKVSYAVLGDVLGVDRDALESISGRDRDAGSEELRQIIRKSIDLLYNRLGPESQASFDSRADKGGPDDLIWLSERIAGRPQSI